MISPKDCMRESFRAGLTQKPASSSPQGRESSSSQIRIDELVDQLDGVVNESRRQGVTLNSKAGPCPLVLDVPEFEKWHDQLIPDELQRVNATYAALRGVPGQAGPLPYVKSEIEQLAARARTRHGKLLAPRDEHAAYKLHGAIKRVLEVARYDFELTKLRTFEAQKACMQLRTDDLEIMQDVKTGEYVNTFNYVRDDEVWVSNLFAGGEGHITSHNEVQFAKLQLLVSTYTNYLFSIRQTQIEPRLGELTVLHHSLDRLLVGQTDLRDAWPKKGNYNAPPKPDRKEQVKYMSPRFKDVRELRLTVDNGRVLDGSNVYEFIDTAERWCAYETHALGMKLKIKGWQADAFVAEADKVLDDPRETALPLKSADAFVRRAVELPRSVVTLREERDSVRHLGRRLKTILENRTDHRNVDNAFSRYGTLLTHEKGQRAYAYNAYEKMYKQLHRLDTDLSYGIRKVARIHESIRGRVEESIKEPVQQPA